MNPSQKITVTKSTQFLKKNLASCRKRQMVWFHLYKVQKEEKLDDVLFKCIMYGKRYITLKGLIALNSGGREGKVQWGSIIYGLREYYNILFLTLAGKDMSVLFFLFCFVLCFRLQNFPDEGSNPCPRQWKSPGGVFLMSLWEKVSSTSFYSASLIWPPVVSHSHNSPSPLRSFPQPS